MLVEGERLPRSWPACCLRPAAMGRPWERKTPSTPAFLAFRSRAGLPLAFTHAPRALPSLNEPCFLGPRYRNAKRKLVCILKRPTRSISANIFQTGSIKKSPRSPTAHMAVAAIASLSSPLNSLYLLTRAQACSDASGVLLVECLLPRAAGRW